MDMKRQREDHYFNAREKIYDRLAQLPKGTIKERVISGWKYYYLQHREGKKVVHKYIGREIPKDLKRQLQEREALRDNLASIQKVLMKFLTARIRDVA